MKGAPRVALTLFSYEALQSWAILLCAVVMGIGVLVREFELSAVFATLMVMVPAMFGGVVLRDASSPSVLHLRPHGRRRMLLGATGTITLVALVYTLPVLVFQLMGLRSPAGYDAFDLPALGTFQFAWGTTALLWVWAFLSSRFQLLFSFSWIPIGVVTLSIGSLDLPSDQLAKALLMTGAAAWAGFAFWYLRTPSVARRRWVTDWSGMQSPLPTQLLARPGAGRSREGKAPVPMAAALRLYLIGIRLPHAPLLLGAAIALLLCVALLFMPEAPPGRLPVDYLMYLTLVSISYGSVIVRRARLVWLRAGLDRAGLFAAAERLALLAVPLLFCVPAAIFIPMSLVARPDRAAAILLFLPAQLALTACLFYVGLAVTRGASVEIVLKFIGLGVLFLVMSITLQPHRGAYVLTYVAAIVLCIGLALLLRRSAFHAWRTLDWRVAGPLPAGVGQRRAD